MFSAVACVLVFGSFSFAEGEALDGDWTLDFEDDLWMSYCLVVWPVLPVLPGLFRVGSAALDLHISISSSLRSLQRQVSLLAAPGRGEEPFIGFFWLSGRLNCLPVSTALE